MTYFELISSNKTEIEYLNKYFGAILENAMINLDFINVPLTTNSDSDKQVIPKIVVVVMVTLYNFRHQYKVIEESQGSKSPGKNKGLRKRFSTFKNTVVNLCAREEELSEFIKADKLSFDTIESASNIFNILHNKSLSDAEYYKGFTDALLEMLTSTAIACPQLSICLIQCWYPLLANLITVNIKKGVDTSTLIQYSVNREIMLRLSEAIMIGFKRISITKSFEITQIKVVLK